MTDKRILVAAHKKYGAPSSKLYLPIQVGADGKECIGFVRDDSGYNISDLNGSFCELTAAYWAWKNLDCEYIGLVHYRRYFRGGEKFGVIGKNKRILSGLELDELLKESDIILPKKRNYFIETLYSHYAHTMYVEPLDEAGRIIAEFYPTYSAEFEKLKERKTAHMFNMFVMKKEIFDGYCDWLFDILFKLKDRVDASCYDSFHARFLGRVSELLLDVYINTNGLKYSEVGVTNAESVNWIKKGYNFLRSKFANKKYAQ